MSPMPGAGPAFDTVNHSILLYKMERLGVRGLALSWLRSYLSERYQQVYCNGSLSSPRIIKFGVLQGSILGPLLFLIFINDLPNASKLLKFMLSADDTNIFASHHSYEALFQLMNEELSHVNDLFALNKLSLNLKKTNYILFRSHRKPIPSNTLTLHINNVEIPKVSSTKFVGILVDQFLTWSDHISNITSKMSRNVGIVSSRPITYLLPQHIRKNLYYTMIHPYISYCNIVWVSNYPTKLLKLHSLQDRAVRMVVGPTCRLSTDQMQKKANILKLDQICTFQTSEFMFK